MLTHFSLFAGIGGIDLAAEWAGLKTVGMCEIDKFCQQVLDKHWPDVPKWGDIFELTGKEILDKCGRIGLLSGGFPCQPFSAAGKRKGEKDKRHLWPEFYRIIREVKPTWVLAENVRGLLSIDAGRTFGVILSDLAESGYRVGWLCYGAGDVGAPHRRERVFIVAYSNRTMLTRSKCKGRAGRAKPADGGKRAVESGVGRVLNEFPCGMDRTKWPAGKWPTPTASDPEGGVIKNVQFDGNSWFRENRHGARWGIKLKDAVEGWPAGPGEQYDWEPPRVATGVKDRVARLKALGNAVVPAQAYPILKAIAEIEGVGV